MKWDVNERQLQQQRLLSEEVPGLKVLFQSMNISTEHVLIQ